MLPKKGWIHMTKRKQLKMGVIIDGVGWSYFGWRHPDMPSDASESFDYYKQKAQKSEAGKFDLIQLVDVSHIWSGNDPALFKYV